MHKPVLVPRTQGIGDYFGEDEILFFEGGNVADLAAKIEWAWRHPAELQGVMEKGRAVYQKNSWDTEEHRLVGLVAGLTGPRPPE